MAHVITFVLTILSFIRDTLKFLWNLIKGDCGYVAEYKENVEVLKKYAETLESKKMDIEKSIELAEMRGEIIKNEVRTWQKRVEDITIEIQKLEEETNKDKKWSCCCSSKCPDLNSRHNLGKQTIKLKKDLDIVINQGQTFSDHVLVSHQGPPPRFTPPPDFHAFESRKDSMESVMRALLDDQVDVIGVHGMGGVGKTYMVKQVATQVQGILGLFDLVVMATVSQTQSVRKIQGQIADKLGLKLEEESESGRADKLRQRILRCKKILVILDDIWNRLDLSQIGIPPVDQKKCKILLTTRRKHVCSVMGSQADISLNVLSADDSWELFMRASVAAQMFDEMYESSVVAREVAGECGGLPIALVTVGRALRDKSINVWKIARRRLARSEDACEDDDDERVFKCLKLSYDFLTEQKGKPFFLLCCLFPEDHNIDKEELARYGMGLGLFPRTLTMEEAREETYAMTDHLKASCLLLHGDNEKSLKMHDVIRDITIRIAFREHGFIVQAGLGLKEYPREQLFERCKAISLMSNEFEVLPERLEWPALQTLLLQANKNLMEISDSFFENMEALKVLDMNHVKIQSIPTSIRLSPNLRTLCLDGNIATDISILGELKKLEILSLKKCPVKELPENLGQLSCLRILDLTLNSRIRIPSKLLPKLSGLEELYMQGSFAHWGQEADACFDELLTLTCLKILRIDVHDVKAITENVSSIPNWGKFDLCINSWPFTRFMYAQSSKFETLHSRALVLGSPIDSLPHWFNVAILDKVQGLIYRQCDGLCNIFEEYHKGRLSSLKSLYIDQCSDVIHLMTLLANMPNEPIFGNLEELHVHQMYIMEDLCSGELPDGSLGNLKFLEVQQCNSMGNVLLSSNLLLKLENLEVLHVSGNSVESVFGSFEGLQKEVQSLREIRMENLPKLTRIWSEPNRIPSYDNLKVLVMMQCEKMKSIFPARMCKNLVHLEEIWVEDCVELEEIVEENIEEDGDEQYQNEEKIIFPQLRKLSLRTLLCLASFYNGSALLECPALEGWHFFDCPKLRTSPLDFHSKRSLRFIDEVELKPPGRR